MTAAQILKELEALGAEGYRNILSNHGVTGPAYGVKVSDLKIIQKRLRKNHALALELYDSGVHDAMYLAGMLVDDALMTRADLQRWVDHCNAPLASSMVAWVAASHAEGFELALAWIDSDIELTAACGWATLSSIVSIRADAALDIGRLGQLLERVKAQIHQAPNEVRKQMNLYVISVGSYVASLTGEAQKIGRDVGPVTVDVGNTACKTPFAPDYIQKVIDHGSLGKKRKAARC